MDRLFYLESVEMFAPGRVGNKYHAYIEAWHLLKE